MAYLVFSALNVVSLFIAAHARKWMWHFWVLLSFLAGFLCLSEQLIGQAIVSTIVGLICIAPLVTWSSEGKANMGEVVWGSPLLAWLESLIIGGLLYVFYQKEFSTPIFECMGAGSLVIGFYLLARKRVSAWIIFMYSFIMFSIASIITNDISGVMCGICQLIMSTYGLIRYMGYYEDVKIKNFRKN